jgi:large subunit ribosomal protein L31
MKKDIHPTYYAEAKVTCACGNNFTVGSTKEHLEVEVCSACHPFYTGHEKIMDKVGRVQKFKERLAQKKDTPKKVKIKKKVKPAEKTPPKKMPRKKASA